MTSSATVADQQIFHRKYIWQWPIRIFHWVNAVSILVLFGTGLYMANPPFSASGETHETFLMANVQKVHYIFAFIFIVSFIWRIYWFWMGR